MKRVILIVLDSLGIGNAPDAESFGDKGANTFCNIVKNTKEILIPNLLKMGISNIDGVDCLKNIDNPNSIYGRLQEVSAGKDTTIGHWEIAGLKIDKALPTYPDGFPDEIIDKFSKEIGSDILCNKPYSGTEVIAKYYKEHIDTKKPIIYTSSDSVFQIAAHEDIIDIERLYEMCKIARNILTGENSVARVIARPFVGEEGNLVRTANRRDFSLDPVKETMLDKIKLNNMNVKAVGKIEDIFNSKGITYSVHTNSNMDGVDKTIELIKLNSNGLIFTNLVDFDAKFGHRRDIEGYKNAIEEFDKRLPEIFSNLRKDDLLILTADHGNDPSYKGTDHTREMVPMLIYKDGINPYNFGTKVGFYNIAKTILSYLDIDNNYDGANLLN